MKWDGGSKAEKAVNRWLALGLCLVLGACAERDVGETAATDQTPLVPQDANAVTRPVSEVEVKVPLFPVDEVIPFPVKKAERSEPEPTIRATLECVEAVVFDDGFRFDAMGQADGKLLVRSIRDARWGARPGVKPQELTQVGTYGAGLIKLEEVTVGDDENELSRNYSVENRTTATNAHVGWAICPSTDV